MNKISVMIVDDQPMVRTGISMLLSAEPDIEVVGMAASGEEALELATQIHADVVLMDVRMPGIDGISATRALVEHQAQARFAHLDASSQATSPMATPDPLQDRLVRVLIMTTFDDEDVVVEALQAGASGYLLKHAFPTEMADAVRRVAGGDTWLDATAAARLVDRLKPQQPVRSGIEQLLTRREQHVFKLIAAGLSNQEIRDHLVLSEATVKTHVARILLKTGSRDRSAAVALAYRSGFVRPDDPFPR